MLKTWIARWASVALVLALMLNAPVRADSPKPIDIPAGNLATALELLSKQAGVGLVYRPEQVRGLETHGVRGAFTAREAVTRLLEGTPLRVSTDTTGAMLIATPLSRNQPAGDSAGAELGAASLEHVARVSDRLHLAQADEPQLAGSAAAAADEKPGAKPAGESVQLDEIVVTANRRQENLHDVPSSISALDQDAIERRNLVGMGDYLNSIPGVSAQDMGVGRNSVVIRGIGISELDRDVTGVYFGEIPLTSLAFFGNADVKLVDMSRVEVLRGPQGTLYGAGAMGGAVRSIPAPPDVNAFHAKASATYSNTAELGGGNSSEEGMVNIPLVEGKVAMRAVGYQFRNSGNYENLAASDPVAAGIAAQYGVPQLAVNEKNVGKEVDQGGRISLLWTPTQEFSATLSYLYQTSQQDGFPEVEIDLGKGDWAQSRLQMQPLTFGSVAFSGGGNELRDRLQTGNLLAEYNLGWASVVSSTSWVKEFAVRNLDNTNLLGLPVINLQGNGANAFFQEVRLSSQLPGRLQFIAGAFFEHVKKDRDVANDYDGAPALNPFDESALLDIAERVSRKQAALFGEVTYRITDTLAATVGGRAFHYSVTDDIDQTGALANAGIVALKSDESNQSYKAALSYKPSSDALFYAQWAQGFRLGFPQQPVIPPGCDVDHDGFIDGTDVSTGITQVNSDSLDSFEIGGKLKLFHNRVAVDVAVFQTDWTGMPVLTGYPCNAEVRLNLGKSRSRGAELSMAWQMSAQLKTDISVSFTDAKILETVEGLGTAGQRLPGSPRYSYDLGFQYDFGIGAVPAFVASNLTYRGELFNDLAQTGTPAGDYYLVDLRGGVNIGRATAALFVKNLTNADDFIWVSQLFNDGRAFRLRPRTVGVEVSYRF